MYFNSGLYKSRALGLPDDWILGGGARC